MASHAQAVYPLRSDYVDALQNPRITLADLALKTGQVECDRLGIPQPISGAFASVFQITLGDSSRWALKCFCQFVPDQERRYNEISTALRMLRHPALVEFEYQKRGILVTGNWYPVLKMEWVEAQGLLPWVEANRFDGRRLRAVADQLVTIIADLESAGIAHGDLQHGNLLVDNADRLRLIDYDGMYVPALNGLPANERGLANYQSPNRQDQHFQPGIDRFSAWIIYASIFALASAPHLWQLHADGDEKLLFDAADYADPDHSVALHALRDTRQGDLIRLAGLIADLARTEVEELPTFNPAGLLGHQVASNTMLPRRTALDLSFGIQDTAAAAPNADLDVPIPLVEHSPSADGSWLSEHLPPVVPKAFADFRSPVIRIVALLVILMGVGLTLAAILMASSPVFGGAATLSSLGVLITILGITYRHHPYYVEARQTHMALKAVKQAVRSAEDAHRSLLDRRARVEADLQDRRKKFGAGRAQLSVQLQQDMAAVQATLSGALATIAQELAAVNAGTADRRAARLQHLQEMHIAQRLKDVQISKNPPVGIGDQSTKRLAQKGIRTAADFTDFYVTGSSRTRDETTWLILPNRQRVHVENIGPKKAQSLVDWRNSVIAYARQSAPSRLGDLVEKQLQAELHAERQRLDQQSAAAKAQAQRGQTAALDRERATKYDLDRQEKEANDSAAARLLNLDQQLADAQREVTAKRVVLGNAQRNCDTYEQITFSRYIRHVTAWKD